MLFFRAFFCSLPGYSLCIICFFESQFIFLIHDSLAISFFFFFSSFSSRLFPYGFNLSVKQDMVLLVAPNRQKRTRTRAKGKKKKQREEKNQRKILADCPITKFTASNPKEMTPFSNCYANTAEYRVQY